MLPDSLYFLLWSKIYSILLLLGLQFLIEYVSYGVFRYLHVFVVSAILYCFLQIQCVSGLKIFQLDSLVRYNAGTVLPCQGTRLCQVLKTLEA